MKILLTGTTGYIAKRLLPVLLNEGHEVICCVRDKDRFDKSKYNTERIKVIEIDFLKKESLSNIPEHLDAAYYLIHSMSSKAGDFEVLEKNAAFNFKERMDQINVKQVIYLGGIVNDENLSKHLRSRRQVEDILKTGNYHLTTLRAGIIVGSGSASFEIIRDLVEKLPLMIAPKWLNTKTQPIAIHNVIEFLKVILSRSETFDKSFDIGGPEILTYKEMLLRFARIRELKRKIFIVPVMSPRLSSYWLYFVTSTSYRLAVNLVNSMKVEVVGKENQLGKVFGINLINYDNAIKMAFERIEQQDVLSSWTDALSSKTLENGISYNIQVPTYGCFIDQRVLEIEKEERVLEKIWSIGGRNGWYYANWLWEFRGFIDKLSGGVGLRRGRRSQTDIQNGESLDFWRVLYANKKERRLLLYAEMKIPGEAWLEFNIVDKTFIQTATFRPLGLWGRLYWYILWPFHVFIFQGMMNRIALKSPP